MKHCGVGRMVTLSNPVSLSDLVQRIKSHLGLSSVRLAIGRGSEDTTVVNTIAICAGSGQYIVNFVSLLGSIQHPYFSVSVSVYVVLGIIFVLSCIVM